MARSIDDWVDLAAAAAPDERSTLLAEAEALCGSAWTWRRLLARAAERGVGDAAWRSRAADRLLEAALAEGDPWGITDAARARGEADGARAALEAGFASMDPAGPAYRWVHLARAFQDLLGDGASARRCLDRSAATDLSSRSEVAVARAQLLGERDAAVSVLSGLAPADAHQAWTLGNAWKALGDPGRGGAVFEAALGGEGLRGVLTLARAWASHEDTAGRDRALGVAERLAGSATDWVDVAEAENDLGLADRVRAALNRARELPLDDDTRPRLAAAWLWLGDADAAEAIGPRGLRPDAFADVVRSLPGFEPSAGALFDDLRGRISEASLREIAAADYGMDYDKHLAALTDLARTGRVPDPLPWEPGEVLRLRRWSDGDGVDHVQRAFCCAVLLLGGEDGHNDEPILVESAVALGEPAAGEAEALLAWRYATSEQAEDRFAALWALALLRAARDPDDARLDALAAHAEEEVEEGASADAIRAYCVREALWTGLSARWFRERGPTARWRALCSPA